MKNNMRKIFRFITLCLPAAAFLACSGNIDPEGETVKLTLTADKTEIVADGNDKVQFTVMNGSQDVTAMAKISCSPASGIVKDNTFTTAAEGTYVFTASYEGKNSDQVSITATAPAASRFARRVCLMEFTGTWCSQCPSGAVTVTYLVDVAYKGKAFAMAFHNEDIYQIPQEQELYKKFRFGGYPGFVTDMRDTGSILDGGCSTSIEKSLYETITHSGAAIECQATANEDGTVTVTATGKAFSEMTMNYRMAAYVIEDKVKGEQKLATNEIDKDYVHRHIVRKMLSASIAGDDLGTVAAESEVSKKYEFTTDKEWNAENVSVAVLVLDDKGHVNNMAICSCMNGKMDYKYSEQ